MPTNCSIRESIAATHTVGIPALPVLAIRGRLCFRCFGPPKTNANGNDGGNGGLARCKGCMRVQYCSRECQRLDWRVVHRVVCRALREVNEVDLRDLGGEKGRVRGWKEYSTNLIQHVRLAASTHKDAAYIVQAQPYCISCRRSANQLHHLAIPLTPCPTCHLVSSCTQCTTTPPPHQCSLYASYAALELFRISLFEDVRDTSVITCTTPPLLSAKPLGDVEGWYEYFVGVSDKGYIRDRIVPDFSGLTGRVLECEAEERGFEEDRRKYLILATDNLTMPLTIISALESLGLTTQSNLDIHILGATSREFLAVNVFEEILHLLPSLQTLRMTAIGPDAWLNAGQTEGFQTWSDLPVCSACQERGRRRPFSVFKGVYHDFAQNPEYTTPDLLVAFNSGFVDGDDAESHWAETIKGILGRGVAALFTAYNEAEARNEEGMLKELGARFVVRPERNRWRGLGLNLEFLSGEGEVWRQNEWSYIVKGRR